MLPLTETSTRRRAVRVGGPISASLGSIRDPGGGGRDDKTNRRICRDPEALPVFQLAVGPNTQFMTSIKPRGLAAVLVLKRQGQRRPRSLSSKTPQPAGVDRRSTGVGLRPRGAWNRSSRDRGTNCARRPCFACRDLQDQGMRNASHGCRATTVTGARPALCP